MKHQREGLKVLLKFAGPCLGGDGLVWIDCSFVISKYLLFPQLIPHNCGAHCALTPGTPKLPLPLPPQQCYPVKLAHKRLTEGGQGKITLKFRKQGKSVLFAADGLPEISEALSAVFSLKNSISVLAESVRPLSHSEHTPDPQG